MQRALAENAAIYGSAVSIARNPTTGSVGALRKPGPAQQYLSHFLCHTVKLKPSYSSEVISSIYAQALNEGGHTVQSLGTLDRDALLSVLEEHQVKLQHRDQIADYVGATKSAESRCSGIVVHHSDVIIGQSPAWRADLGCTSTQKIPAGET
jgi:hypothetical protein